MLRRCDLVAVDRARLVKTVDPQLVIRVGQIARRRTVRIEHMLLLETARWSLRIAAENEWLSSLSVLEIGKCLIYVRCVLVVLVVKLVGGDRW